MSDVRPRLLIYADEDYLLPIIMDEDGEPRWYEAAGDFDNRLWLYFKNEESGISYDKAFKNRALYKDAGYYCNIWEALVADRKVRIDNNEHPFWDLLRTSALISDIETFWKQSILTPFNRIPTVYLFADSAIITDDSKSCFIAKMMEEGFDPVSFSVNPNIPICRYIQNEITSFNPSFGDNILFLTSVGETLRFSSAVFDGDSFLTDGRTGRVENFGEALLKNSLVRYIVDAINHSCGGFLTTEEKREAEYGYQLRNADKWFNIRRDSNGDFDVQDFLFSFDPKDQSPRTTLVRGSFLATEQENIVRQTIEKINQFVCDLGKKPSYVVFCGEAFKDDSFTSKILQKLNVKDKSIFTENTFAKALFQYFDIFQDKEECFNDFDKIFKDIQKANEVVSDWIKNAGKIIVIEQDLSRGKKDLEDSLKEDDECLSQMMNRCADYLKESRFKEARQSLLQYKLPSSRVVSAKKNALAAREKSLDMTPVYERIEVIGRARLKVSAIHALEAAILNLGRISDDNATALKSRNTRIDELEAKYPEYIRLKRQFEKERDYRTKRDLIGQMRAVTEEDLPELSLPQVLAVLSARIEVGGGLFRKTRTLKFNVAIEEGRQLPCDAELHIATKSLTSVEDRMCFSYDIPKGSSGTISGELKLPHQFVEPKKTIYLYLFPGEKVVDKNAVKADFIYVKQ